ncbi:MAG: T9SS type A sorting domain-containing protein, partial [Flavobacteriales bacterium]
TKTSDRKWRRNAFRVADYVTPTNNMKIRFVASDSLRPGQNLDGGSLVEAAVDDVQIWDNMDPNNVEESGVVDGIQFLLRPNPATDQLLVSFELYESSHVEVVLMDMAGRVIWNRSFGAVQPGISTQPVNVANVESGVYQVVLRSGGKTLTHKLIIQH